MLDIDDICTLDEFDRQTLRLEWAAKLRGDSRAEVVELVTARERERARIAEEIYGPRAD